MKLTQFILILFISVLVISCNKTDDKVSKKPSKESKNISIKMAAAFPSSLIILGETGVKLTKKINDVSGGNINIKYFEIEKYLH